MDRSLELRDLDAQCDRYMEAVGRSLNTHINYSQTFINFYR